MELFFSSLKTERIGSRVYRTRDEARADVFDYIERFYNPVQRHMEGGIRLTGCPQNRQQLKAGFRIRRAAFRRRIFLR